MIAPMTRRLIPVALLAATGLLAGCEYDPATGGFYPCCGYAPYAYPYLLPYPPPYAPYPSPLPYPSAGYPEAAPSAAELPSGATLEQDFDAANTTHDGRLTLAQAEAAHWWPVVQNFPAIDIGQKGYVTLNDIQVWLAAHRPDSVPPRG